LKELLVLSCFKTSFRRLLWSFQTNRDSPWRSSPTIRTEGSAVWCVSKFGSDGINDKQERDPGAVIVSELIRDSLS